jgi:protein-S-isoprenylcysteine O-methyltransferase Ste14
MRRRQTNILPHRAAGRLVTTGPFSFTRNPIYVGNATLMAGVGVAFGNLWFVLLGVVSALAVDRLAIRREERHLAARFGQEWIDYASRVPRWLI